MIQRCHVETDISYKNYGARGIIVSDTWKTSYSGFESYVLGALGDRPEGYTLDRIDNSKGYQPGNLQWASRSDQNKNRRPSKPRSK